MVLSQDTLIYIEENEKIEASIAAKGFANVETQNRVYINTLGAELALKYLVSENINIENIRNVHSIKKVIEELDIADIMLPNIHIDVRVVFDDNLIFIPKTHFEYEITPDIYIVFKLAENLSQVSFLGFFEPKLINKNNSNEDYYFIEKEKLNSPIDLKNFITNFKGNTNQNLSEEELEKSETIILSMIDNTISKRDKKLLLKQLTQSLQLRDKFIEYENFELLSYRAITDNDIQKREIQSQEIIPVSGFDNILEQETTEENINLNNDIDSIPSIDDITANDTDNITKDNSIDSKDQTKLNSGDLLEDAATLGTTAILGAGAASTAEASAVDAITDGIETIKNGTEIVSDIADSIAESIPTIQDIDSLVDLGLETETPNNDTPEIISFSDIEPLNVDTENSKEEEFTEEFISLENVQDKETTIDDENFSENLYNFDNNISLDETQIPNMDIPPLPDTDNYQDETISLDNTINPENFDDVKTDFDNDIPETEIISLDDVDTSSINNEPEEETFDNTISLDENNTTEEIITNNTEMFDTSSEELEAEMLDTNFDDNLISDTISQESNTIEELVEEPQIIESITDKSDEELTDENNINIEDGNSNSNTEAFGKNLLESLSEENIDDISIDSIDNSSFDTSNNTDVDDISSNDLLAEIDNVLNASNNYDQEEITNHTDTNNDIQNEINNENSFSEDMPNTHIEDLLGFGDSETDENYENHTEAPQIVNNTPKDDIASLVDQIETNYIPDENIEDDQNNEKLSMLFDDEKNYDYEDNETQIEDDGYVNDNNLYTQTDNNEDFIQSAPGAALYNKSSGSLVNKKMILASAVIIAVIASASAFIFLKSKNNTSDINTITQNNNETGIIENTSNNTPSDITGQNDTQSNILETNTPDINEINKKELQKIKANKELKNIKQNTKTKSATASESYLSVDKLVWDVPDYLSYSNKIKSYLMTAGKSIKLSLSADLLLATEYAYSNQIKVNINMDPNGNVQSANIVSSSGSKQIDEIVLQSVKNTLNVIKPPSGEVKGPNFNLGLIIYL